MGTLQLFKKLAVSASGLRWRECFGDRWLGGVQRRMSLSELTFGKIVQRFFVYVGIALAVLVVFGVAIVLSKGAKISGTG